MAIWYGVDRKRGEPPLGVGIVRGGDVEAQPGRRLKVGAEDGSADWVK